MYYNTGRLVGICGYAGSGKSTFAGALVANHGFYEYSFAAPLKALCANTWGWDLQALSSDDAAQRIGFATAFDYKAAVCPRLGRTRREALQHIGTQGFRQLDPDHWVKETMKVVRPCINSGGSVVISDVRFPNESRAIQAEGGLVVRIRRVGQAGPGAGAHASERAIDDIVPNVYYTIADGVANVIDNAAVFVRTPWERFSRIGGA